MELSRSASWYQPTYSRTWMSKVLTPSSRYFILRKRKGSWKLKLSTYLIMVHTEMALNLSLSYRGLKSLLRIVG